MMKRLKNKKGFTLIELSLSLVFIGVLSITIVLIINNTITTYQRGLTLNQINTVGMEIVDDMRAAIRSSFPILEENDSGCGEGENCSRTLYTKKSNDVEGVDEDIPIAGAFCTGTYSYIWNSGYLIGDSIDDGVYYGEKQYKLGKIKDNGDICSGLNENASVVGSNIISEKEGVEMEELLGENDNNLALYSLEVNGPVKNNANNTAFYAVSFILGTTRGGINIIATGDFCKAPQEANSDFNYCAINKFNFAARANGGKDG